MELEQRETLLRERLERIEALEAEVKRREGELKARENNKKQVPLRLSPTLWNDLAAMAEEDFRSINGEIEFLLTQCVKGRRKRPPGG